MVGKKAKKKLGNLSLRSEERETLINHNCSDNGIILIYTSEQTMTRKLMDNPLFKLTEKFYNKNYACFPKPIAIKGILPLKCLTIRTKIRKITIEQWKKLTESLKHARKARRR